MVCVIYVYSCSSACATFFCCFSSVQVPQKKWKPMAWRAVCIKNMLCSAQAKSSSLSRWFLRTGCYVLIFHLVLPFLKRRLPVHTDVPLSHNPGSYTSIVIISLYSKCPMVIISFNLHKRPRKVLLLFQSSN